MQQPQQKTFKDYCTLKKKKAQKYSKFRSLKRDEPPCFSLIQSVPGSSDPTLAQQRPGFRKQPDSMTDWWSEKEFFPPDIDINISILSPDSGGRHRVLQVRGGKKKLL